MDTKNFNYIDKAVSVWRLAKVLKHIKKDDVVLDFGCGAQGYFLRTVSKKIKNGVGIDYDVEANKFGNLEFIKQKAITKLPFKDKEFDKIVLLAVVEHIQPDLTAELFLEFKRILKNNGEIVLTTPTPFGKYVLEFLAYKLHVISDAEIRDHKKYYDREGLLKLAAVSSLKLVDYKLFQLGINSCATFKKNN